VRIGWRLGTILILFAATAAVLHLAPPVTGAVNPASLHAVPPRLGQWSGTDGVPDEILPPDPYEKLSLRRTYRNGDRVAWIAVALFVGQDDEVRRGSINKIYPQRSVSRIEPVSFTVALNGPATNPISLPAVIIHQDSRRLLVAYWHQIGNRAYGNDYRFRFALMRDVVFARRADSMLVRVATPVGSESQVVDDLAVVAALAPDVYTALAKGVGE
jgi:EpsI family protein